MDPVSHAHDVLAALESPSQNSCGVLLRRRAAEVLPGRQASYSESTRLAPWLRRLVRAELAGSEGDGLLYRHQARAIDLLLDGQNVILSTPTASGKTLAFTLPAVQMARDRDDFAALFIYPTRALVNDQRRSLDHWLKLAGMRSAHAAAYDGATDAVEREAIRRESARLRVLIMTPEMVHLSLLGHHRKWAGLLRRLGLVVLDEVHLYRGYFGANMAYLMRRLRQMVKLYRGTPPRFLGASATVEGADRHFGSLIGEGCVEVPASQDGSPCEAKTVLLVEVLQGGLLAASAELTRRLVLGLAGPEPDGIVTFLRTRKMVEDALLYVQRYPQCAPLLAGYRSGYANRMEIENKLRNGKIKGVFTTNALELGIDYGRLSYAVLSGLPGTMTEFMQRSGRVGRSGAGVVILLGGEDLFDQYFLAHPRRYVERAFETPAVPLDNEFVAVRHLACALQETKGRRRASLDPSLLSGSIGRLYAEHLGGAILDPDLAAFLQHREPHFHMGLRGAEGESLSLLADGVAIGEIGERQLMTETYPGAIYLHGGRRYRVERLDRSGGVVYLKRFVGGRRTKPSRMFKVAVREVLSAIEGLGDGLRCAACRVNVIETVTGFRELDEEGRVVKETTYETPQWRVLRTTALLLEAAPAAIGHGVDASRQGCHALEHLLHSAAPLVVACDPSDLGAKQWVDGREGSVCVYDAVEGGIGIAEALYRSARRFIESAADALDACACKDDAGCPRCIQSRGCERMNAELSKSAAAAIAKVLLGRLPEPRPAGTISPPGVAASIAPRPPEATGREASPPAEPSPKNGVFEQGSIIHHPEFGLGCVESYRRVGGAWKSDIRFGGGVKTILTRACAARIRLIKGREGLPCAGCRRFNPVAASLCGQCGEEL